MSKRPPPLTAAVASSVIPESPQSQRGNGRAAVVKRGAEREKRDLFADHDEPVASSKSEQPPPSYGFNGGVGSRNESSVLFRVDQLASGRVHTPEAVPAVGGGFRGDDDGVIDLKALSSSSASRPPAGMAVAPLFSEPPPVTLEVRNNRPNAQPTSRLAIAFGISAAAVVMLAAGFGIAMAFRGEEPVKHAAAIVVAPAPPPPPAATPAPAPEPPPATTEDDAKAKKAKRGKGKAKGVAAATAATPKTVKPADPCGCHGDFNCILACTAHGGK